jgi:squalene synthase HpnC
MDARDTLLAVQRADAWCRAYGRAHAENFTVVSWFLPRELRPHFLALYAFCRATDDLGDEAAGDRLALLDAHEDALRACYEGRRDHPLFIALGRTIDACSIPADPFLRLIEANRIDQRLSHVDTYDDLLNYCRYSATPVGEMVLHVLGYHDERRRKFSDAICIGLQLANFWQDVSVDLHKGRIYIPRADMARFGYDEEDLRQGRATEAFRNLMRFEVERARQLFAYGRPLEDLVDGRARLDVALFRRGGEAALSAIEAAGFDVLSRRPPVSRLTKARLMLTQALALLAASPLQFMKGHAVA